MPSAEPSRSTPSPSSDSPTNWNQVRYLTTQDIIELHRAVSVEFGGNQAQPGVVDSQFGLLNAIQRPQTTVFGRDAYPTFGEKAAAFLFALLQNSPFRGGNRRVALASLLAFCELNDRSLDPRVLDEKMLETIVKRAATYKETGVAPEVVFRDIRDLMNRAITRPRP